MEVILDRCSEALDATGTVSQLDRERVMSEVEKMASNGLRVLAFAKKKVSAQTAPFDHEDDDVKISTRFSTVVRILGDPRG